MFEHLLLPMILMFSVIQTLHSLEAIRILPTRVRTAVEYSDYFDIVCHKHRSLLSGFYLRADYHHGSICRMMSDADQKHFMAYKGTTLVGCADLVTLDLGNHYHVQNVVVGHGFRRLGVATSLLSAVEEYVTLEKAKLLLQNKFSFSEATLELDVDRSNPSAKSLYFKNGYLPRFSWRNLLNHRQKMFKIFSSPGLVREEVPVTALAHDYMKQFGLNINIPDTSVYQESYTLSAGVGSIST